MQELCQAFVHFVVSEKGPKWVCLLNMKQNKMDGCSEAIKMVLLVPKGKKKYNNNEINETCSPLFQPLGRG